MRFLLEFTTVNYKVRHATALELKKLYPDSVFAGTASSHGDIARKYLESQQDINYEFLYNMRDVVNGFLGDFIDDDIKKLQKTCKHKNRTSWWDITPAKVRVKFCKDCGKLLKKRAI
jgi:hypothetical protein